MLSAIIDGMTSKRKRSETRKNNYRFQISKWPKKGSVVYSDWDSTSESASDDFSVSQLQKDGLAEIRVRSVKPRGLGSLKVQAKMKTERLEDSSQLELT